MRQRKRKFRKAMKATGLILKNPHLLNHVLSEPDVWKDYVVKNHEREKGLPVINLDQLVVKKFTRSVPLHSWMEVPCQLTSL